MPTIINGTDNTAATPALTGSDTDTGVFFPAANTMAFSTGATEKMRVDSSGNVGIGTSSPTTILNAYNATSAIIQVDGDSVTQLRAARYSTDGTAPQITLRKSRGTLASPTTVASSDSAGLISYQAYDGTTFRGVAGIQGGVESYTGTDNLAGALIFSTRPSGSAAVNIERGRFDSSGNFQFNSGYGSVATAYGCRAWVNFNGTGTVAIRSSGNVSSITDNGTGDYTVNFTTAMPDANYSAVTTVDAPAANIYSVCIKNGVAPTTTSVRLSTGLVGTAFADCGIVTVAIFR